MPPNNRNSPKSRKKKDKFQKKIKDVGEVWRDGRPSDIVVVVMGQTGAGKSTFITRLISGMVDKSVELPVIGEDMKSCTIQIEPFPIPITIRNSKEKSRLVIVDTPGFDDTFRTDHEILRRIAEWLAFSYSTDMKLGGVIYLHDITQPRMLGSTLKNFQMFDSLCGKSAAEALILVTTKWQDVLGTSGSKREKQLRDEFWKDMLKRGARTARFEDNQMSALTIVGKIVGSDLSLVGGTLQIQRRDPKEHLLQIQEELVDLEKIIPDTEAGQKLRYTIQELRDMQKQQANKLKGQELEEKLNLIRDLSTEIAQLKPPGFFKRLFSF